MIEALKLVFNGCLLQTMALLGFLKGVSMQAVFDFLKVRTPQAWLTLASNNLEILLIDHAHCEKKAASNALNLIFRYADRIDLLYKMTQLAREELLHFEQVLELMTAKGIVYDHLPAAHYAQRLRHYIRKQEPGRLVDTLIVGAVIEARSCERFSALADYFEEIDVHYDLVKYYRYLLKSESRHFLDYLDLARLYAVESIEKRIEFFLEQDRLSINTPDTDFRFHSGVYIEQLELMPA